MNIFFNFLEFFWMHPELFGIFLKFSEFYLTEFSFHSYLSEFYGNFVDFTNFVQFTFDKHYIICSQQTLCFLNKQYDFSTKLMFSKKKYVLSTNMMFSEETCFLNKHYVFSTKTMFSSRKIIWYQQTVWFLKHKLCFLKKYVLSTNILFSNEACFLNKNFVF